MHPASPLILWYSLHLSSFYFLAFKITDIRYVYLLSLLHWGSFLKSGILFWSWFYLYYWEYYLAHSKCLTTIVEWMKSITSLFVTSTRIENILIVLDFSYIGAGPWLLFLIGFLYLRSWRSGCRGEIWQRHLQKPIYCFLRMSSRHWNQQHHHRNHLQLTVVPRHGGYPTGVMKNK